MEDVIDVWLVTDGKTKYYQTNKNFAYEVFKQGNLLGETLKISQEQMSRSYYEKLSEFGGF